PRVSRADCMSETISRTVNERFRRLSRVLAGIIVVLLIVQIVVFILLYARAQSTDTQSTLSVWLIGLLVTTAILLALYVLIAYYLNQSRAALNLELTQAYGKELRSLRAANDRAISLQAMASTL